MRRWRAVLLLESGHMRHVNVLRDSPHMGVPIHRAEDAVVSTTPDVRSQSIR